ncbi:MAG: leucyl aminopeptidase [Parvicellaceae bacterium]|jgi:leucyl aminopeptidase
MVVKNVKKASNDAAAVHLVTSVDEVSKLKLPSGSKAYVKDNLKKKKTIKINHVGEVAIVALIDSKDNLERTRELGSTIGKYFNQESVKKAHISGTTDADRIIAFTEGLVLGNYQFLKYYSDAKKRKNSVSGVELTHESIGKAEVTELNHIIRSVFEVRDLVNEPQSYLTATQLSNEIKRISTDAGYKVEVLNQKKIESLKMGGLLAVNQGSVEPATFSILEWKPKNAINSKPYVLVGKGVVYDTGGLSLKPTANSMDIMKCDMGGAAMMVGAMSAIAGNELPVHVICLIPATDNRPGGNAYAPGDVVTMYSGKTVEVLNTDAEGRMILADALSYASQYDPELVIDAATLTGAAARAIGPEGIVAMGTAGDEEFEDLNEAGNDVYERIVQLPFWDEYGEQIKSQIADIKNIGGASGGAITAGKFLEHFTDYPYIHLDIAGPAWLDKESHYRSKGGSGVGVRILYQFFKSKCEE